MRMASFKEFLKQTKWRKQFYHSRSKIVTLKLTYYVIEFAKANL